MPPHTFVSPLPLPLHLPHHHVLTRRRHTSSPSSPHAVLVHHARLPKMIQSPSLSSSSPLPSPSPSPSLSPSPSPSPSHTPSSTPVQLPPTPSSSSSSPETPAPPPQLPPQLSPPESQSQSSSHTAASSFKPSELPRLAIRIITQQTAKVTRALPGTSSTPFKTKASPAPSAPDADRPPVRNAQIAILTDFSANPLLAVRDRASDPVFATMLFIATFLGFLVSRIATGRPVSAKTATSSTSIVPIPDADPQPDANGEISPFVQSVSSQAAAVQNRENAAVDVVPLQVVQPPPSPIPVEEEVSPSTATQVSRGRSRGRAARSKARRGKKAARGVDTPVQPPESKDVTPPPSPSASSSIAENSAIWLNMSIRTLWRLFRKSTASLTRDVIQPVLDIIPLPNYIRSIQISDLSLGESPPLVREIHRIPSRALAELQYRFNFRLIGDKHGYIDLRVAVQLPGLPGSIVVPVRVSNIDIDASVWLAVTFVPYAPWVRFVHWALKEMPSAKFSISVGNVLPVTAIPLLSNVLTHIFTVELPRQFLFPKGRMADLLRGRGMDAEAALDRGLLDANDVSPTAGTSSNEELRGLYPGLAALFDTLDVNGDGLLDKDELSSGLIEWGFASVADRVAIAKLLDVNNDGLIQLREFLSVWGDLQSVFVPRRFRGVINGVLLTAEGLRTPLIGWTDPYVVFRVESQTATSKRSLSSKQKGEKSGFPVWNEGWEVYVQQPKTATLRVEVREASKFSVYKEKVAAPQLPSSHSGSEPERPPRKEDTLIAFGSIEVSKLTDVSQALWVEMTAGRGRVNIEAQFNEFVDPQYAEE